MTKREYLCKLNEIIEYPQRSGQFVARIQRMERHARLGEVRDGEITTTSKLIWVNFARKVMETQNSIYRWI